MALRWDATNVAEWHDWDNDKKDRMANFAWELMAIGIGDVTQDNVGEIWARMVIWHGTFRDVPSYKLEEVQSMIGFHTNVGYEKQDAWLKRLIGGRIRDIADSAQKLVTA